jgi:hypothetical protein
MYIKIKIYRTVISPVVLYGCGTWSVMFREECTIGGSIGGFISNVLQK